MGHRHLSKDLLVYKKDYQRQITSIYSHYILPIPSGIPSPIDRPKRQLATMQYTVLFTLAAIAGSCYAQSATKVVTDIDALT